MRVSAGQNAVTASCDAIAVKMVDATANLMVVDGGWRMAVGGLRLVEGGWCMVDCGWWKLEGGRCDGIESETKITVAKTG